MTVLGQDHELPNNKNQRTLDITHKKRAERLQAQRLQDQAQRLQDVLEAKVSHLVLSDAVSVLTSANLVLRAEAK
jgi:hypothetical protein